MALDPEIAVRVGADITALKREMSKGGQILKKFRKGVNQGTKDYKKYGGAAALAGVAIATGIVKNTLAAVDAQAKLAKQIKSSTEQVDIMTRAGSLAGVSLKEITNASLKLEINAGKAAQGLSAQKRAFDAMGISAQEVLKLPLSERFLAINKAIKDNVESTEQAAVASDLFGAKNASLIRLLDPATIARAAEETELFGTQLNNIDAAKVENANDAMGTFGLAAQGAAKQLTIKLAPILQKIGDDFKGATKEAGGMGNAVGDGVNTAIKALGFLLDAVEGVKRVFQVVGKTIAIAFGTILLSVQQKVATIASMLDAITPGDAFKNLSTAAEAQANTTREIMTGLATDIKDILAEPLPSTALQEWIKEAEIAGQKAAEAAANAQSGGDSGDKATDPVAALTAQEEKRLEVLRNSIKTEEELLNQKYAKDLELLQNQFQLKGELTAQDQAVLEAMGQKHSDALAAIKQSEQNATVGAAKDGLTALSGLMNTENKKQFKVGKQAAIAKTVMDTYSAAQGAYSSLASIPYVGPALGIAAAGAAIASGQARISSIKSQSFGGGGSAKNSGGGGGSAPSLPGAGGGAPADSRNINISGVNPSDFVQVGGLVEKINEELGDGANLNINFAGA